MFTLMLPALQAVSSCPQTAIRIKGWGVPRPQHPQCSRFECRDGGIAAGSAGVGGRRGAEISPLFFPRKPRSDHQLKNAVVLSRDTGTLKEY